MAIRDLVDARELTTNLTIRDLKVRYKGSVLGFFWSLLNPVLLAGVFTLVFGFLGVEAPKVAGRSSFPLFLLTGLLPWNYLVNCMAAGATSITGSGSLIRKVYFPRGTLPLSVVLAHGVSFLLELVVLFAFLAAFGFPFWRTLYLLPFLLVFYGMFVLGLSMLLSAVNVYFRDTQQLLTIFTLVWFYLTPILYPISFARDHLDGIAFTLYQLNPAAAFVDAFRSILYFGDFPSAGVAAYVPAIAIVTLLGGYAVFTRLAPRRAEEV
jgi:lipopolysaccharide transport system permease protein